MAEYSADEIDLPTTRATLGLEIASLYFAGTEVLIEAPVVQDERTKELLREYAQLHPEDPRTEIWTKV